jgi:hypothetical protein
LGLGAPNSETRLIAEEIFCPTTTTVWLASQACGTASKSRTMIGGANG